MFHNLFCTILSLYMCIEIWRQAYLGGYSLFSQSIDRTSAGLPMASVLWVFYASKVPEFMDTILMALKRNFRQITFLHVYHHSSIFVIWWFIMSYVPSVFRAEQRQRATTRDVLSAALPTRLPAHSLYVYVFVLFVSAARSGGSSYFSAALNSFVHVVMYGE